MGQVLSDKLLFLCQDCGPIHSLQLCVFSEYFTPGSFSVRKTEKGYFLNES